MPVVAKVEVVVVVADAAFVVVACGSGVVCATVCANEGLKLDGFTWAAVEAGAVAVVVWSKFEFDL